MKQNEELVSDAFSAQSVIFDRINVENKLTDHLRDIYRAEIESQSVPGSSILELNCGTGLDSLYFASKGHPVMATDNAEGMIAQLQEKIKTQHSEDKIETRRCSFSALNQLGDVRFDYIISNFGGLNCSDNLDKILLQFKDHLNEHGKVTMAIMPRVSPWELVMVLKGKFKTAFRRFRKNTPAHVEGVHFSVYYYNPSYVMKVLRKDFDLVTLKGVYFAVPPDFYEGFVERYPKMYRFLKAIERRLGNWFPFNVCCDHYLITLQKK
jgi:ubiquinone/menaquinone biosynthesis C-methylase UbiE